ncbi:hypothetical protein [Clavibacter tessellarius]|uniref:hypothetical protein n=1 Tax=Clavibacter tessellarius TaxID=31965 RepID=UPI0039ED057F
MPTPGARRALPSRLLTRAADLLGAFVMGILLAVLTLGIAFDEVASNRDVRRVHEETGADGR